MLASKAYEKDDFIKEFIERVPQRSQGELGFPDTTPTIQMADKE